MTNENNKNRLILIIGISASIVLSLLNSFLLTDLVPYLPMALSFIFDALFLLFGVLLANREKNFKSILSTVFILITVFVALAIQLMDVLAVIVADFIPHTMIGKLAAYGLETVIWAAAYLLLLKLSATGKPLFGKGFVISAVVGLVLLVAIRFLLFTFIEAPHYDAMTAPGGAFDYFALMDAIQLSTTVSWALLRITPLVFGATATSKK